MGMFQNYRRCSLLATTCLEAPSPKARLQSRSGIFFTTWANTFIHPSGKAFRRTIPVINISCKLVCTNFVRFYTERWITDEEFIPSNSVDLMVLRTKFEESVRRHLLAEVIISTN